jgi:hypothetical protein
VVIIILKKKLKNTCVALRVCVFWEFRLIGFPHFVFEEIASLILEGFHLLWGTIILGTIELKICYKVYVPWSMVNFIINILYRSICPNHHLEADFSALLAAIHLFPDIIRLHAIDAET